MRWSVRFFEFLVGAFIMVLFWDAFSLDTFLFWSCPFSRGREASFWKKVTLVMLNYLLEELYLSISDVSRATWSLNLNCLLCCRHDSFLTLFGMQIIYSHILFTSWLWNNLKRWSIKGWHLSCMICILLLMNLSEIAWRWGLCCFMRT